MGVVGNRVALGCALAVIVAVTGAPAAALASTPQPSTARSLLPAITIDIPPIISVTLLGEDAPDPVAEPEDPAPEVVPPSPEPTPTVEQPAPPATPVVPPPAPPVAAPAPAVPLTPATSGITAPVVAPKSELPTEAAPTEVDAAQVEGPTTVSTLTDDDAALAGRLPNGGSGREDLLTAADREDDGLSRMLAPALAVSTFALASLAGGALLLHQRIADSAPGHGRRRAEPAQF